MNLNFAKELKSKGRKGVTDKINKFTQVTPYFFFDLKL